MRIEIANFRSIRQQELELAPITVIYGPNGAGKSSLLYALLTMRNVVMNPNQNPNGFFNYGFANIGGFETVVFDHQKHEEIEIGLEVNAGEQRHPVAYYAAIGDSDGRFTLEVDDLDISVPLSVTFPYPGNRQVAIRSGLGGPSADVLWNGLIARANSDDAQAGGQDGGAEAARLLNAPVELLRRLGVVPLGRGFTKPHYSVTPDPDTLSAEDKLAEKLAKEPDLAARVSGYTERVFDRGFRIGDSPATGWFSLLSRDGAAGIETDLVNDGFGVNQAVFLLTKCLYRETALMCIEEPEIHMHPSAVRRMAAVFVDMKRDEGKRFVISTHSEQFVLALLALVAKRQLATSELACYFARKESKETIFERQEINEKGQIDGGLGSFMEGELEDLKAMLGVPE